MLKCGIGVSNSYLSWLNIGLNHSRLNKFVSIGRMVYIDQQSLLPGSEGPERQGGLQHENGN